MITGEDLGASQQSPAKFAVSLAEHLIGNKLKHIVCIASPRSSLRSSSKRASNATARLVAYFITPLQLTNPMNTSSPQRSYLGDMTLTEYLSSPFIRRVMPTSQLAQIALALVLMGGLMVLAPDSALAGETSTSDIDGLGNANSNYSSGTDLTVLGPLLGFVDILFGPLGIGLCALSLAWVGGSFYFGNDYRQGLQKSGKWAIGSCVFFGGGSLINFAMDGALM